MYTVRKTWCDFVNCSFFFFHFLKKQELSKKSLKKKVQSLLHFFQFFSIFIFLSQNFLDFWKSDLKQRKKKRGLAKRHARNAILLYVCGASVRTKIKRGVGRVQLTHKRHLKKKKLNLAAEVFDFLFVVLQGASSKWWILECFWSERIALHSIIIVFYP